MDKYTKQVLSTIYNLLEEQKQKTGSCKSTITDIAEFLSADLARPIKTIPLVDNHKDWVDYGLLADVDELPVNYQAGLRLYNAVKDRESYKDILEIIQSDNVMTLQLCKLLRSPIYGFVDKVVNPEDVKFHHLVHISEKTLKQLAVNGIFRKGNFSCATFCYNRFSQLALARAITAKNIRQMDIFSDCIFSDDEMYLLGFVAHGGQLAFAYHYPQHYSKLLEKYGKGSWRVLAEAERLGFGINHCELGRLMLLKSGFPESAAMVIKNLYYHPDRFPDDSLAKMELEQLQKARFIIRCGNALANHMFGNLDSYKPEIEELFPKRSSHYGLTEAELLRMKSKMSEEWKEMKETLVA